LSFSYVSSVVSRLWCDVSAEEVRDHCISLWRLAFHATVCRRCFLQRWYWCGQTTNVGGNTANDSPDYGDRAKFFEPTMSNRNVGIKIRNLTKVSTSWLFTGCTMHITWFNHRFIYAVVQQSRDER